jgi:hypothetical protein
MTYRTERPPSASLVNLSDNTEQIFLVNPQTIDETLEAEYKRNQVIGSLQRLQYVGTGNLVIPIEIYLDESLQRKFGPNNDQQPTISQKKAWLQSLLYPASSADYSRVGAPRVLLNWPNVVRIVARVVRYNAMHREFDGGDLRALISVVRLTLEEDLQVRKLMEDITVEGSLHAGPEV